MPSSVTAKWSVGSPSEPSKRKCLPVSRSRSTSGRPARVQQLRDARVDLDQERLDVGLLGRQVAQLALDLDRHRLLGEHHALAVAGRARLVMISRTPSVTFWRVISTRPERRDLHHVGLRAVLVERLAQRLQHRVAVARARHVDEVDDDDPADVAQPQLAHDLLSRLEVRLRDRVLEPGPLPRPVNEPELTSMTVIASA